MGDAPVPVLSSTALLCVMVFLNTFVVGAFGPLLPEVARSQGLADWQLGAVAGAFGFARMAAALPAGALAGRRLGSALAAAPLVLAVGVLVLTGARSLPMLLLGRAILGLAHTLGMVGGLTAILLDHRTARMSLRLNIFEFAGMLGVLGGLALVGGLPERWGWSLSFLVASSPLLVVIALGPVIRSRFPDACQDRARRPEASTAHASGAPMPPVVWLMLGVGAVMALAWSAVSQFVIPVRGWREFGLDRGGISWMLAIAQVVDLAVLLPVGRAADALSKRMVLGVVVAVLGFGTICVGLGSFPWFVLGCACFGIGLAGWMLPLGLIREHTSAEALAWRTGLYRMGVDAAIFLGPLVAGALTETGPGFFAGAVGALAMIAGAHLLWRPMLSSTRVR